MLQAARFDALSRRVATRGLIGAIGAGALIKFLPNRTGGGVPIAQAQPSPAAGCDLGLARKCEWNAFLSFQPAVALCVGAAVAAGLKGGPVALSAAYWTCGVNADRMADDNESKCKKSLCASGSCMQDEKTGGGICCPELTAASDGTCQGCSRCNTFNGTRCVPCDKCSTCSPDGECVPLKIFGGRELKMCKEIDSCCPAESECCKPPLLFCCDPGTRCNSAGTGCERA